MGAITIRNLDEAVLAAIKRRAADGGISLEEEVRRLLAATYSDAETKASCRTRWARRQMDRLKQGELPKATMGAVEEIRRTRQQRGDHRAKRHTSRDQVELLGKPQR